jgi:translation initiation factor 3 subunit G
MSNWADQAQEEEIYDEVASNNSYSAEHEDLKKLWENAKTETSHETDADGNNYIVTRKVRQYHVDRPITTADLRAHLKHFGKGLGDQSAMVSTEPPLALEMGSVDQWERETRTEVKRMIHEASSIEVVVKDPHLCVIRDLEEKNKKTAPRTAASGSTWGSVASKPTDSREQISTGIRIRNVSDDVTQENLSRIFEGFGWTAKSVRIPRGDNNQTRGFAFVIFDEPWMAEAAIKKGKFHFKNVVLDVSRAETRV